jgi:hypothetical protein
MVPIHGEQRKGNGVLCDICHGRGVRDLLVEVLSVIKWEVRSTDEY